MAVRVTKYDPNSTFNLIAGEAIAEGDLCGVTSATTRKAYKADGNATHGAAATNKALGYAVKAAAAGDAVALAPICELDGFSGLTPGDTCYLDVTAGGLTQTKTSTNTETLQTVGVALSATAVAGVVGVPQKYQTAGNSTLTSL